MRSLVRTLTAAAALVLILAPTAAAGPYAPEFVSAWGGAGSGNGQFASPVSLATDSAGNVYIADAQNNRIQKFAADGTYLGQWGSAGSGDGQFSAPTGLAIDSADNVYVADSSNHRVQKFTSAGVYVAQWGSLGSGPNQFVFTFGLATDSADNVYVVDGTDRVQKFTSAGTLITAWGSSGSGDGQFDDPYDVAVDAADNVYVVERGGQRLQKFTSTGAFLDKWGSLGPGDGQFQSPLGVSIGPTGLVYVADADNERVQIFDGAGTFLDKFSMGFLDNRDVHATAAGDVYVADSGNNRVMRFREPDTTPPDTVIDTGPSGTVESGDATFTFHSTEVGSTFSCALDGGTPEPCASSKSYSDLPDGAHSFSVVAADSAGNPDPTPATRDFEVRRAQQPPPGGTPPGDPPQPAPPPPDDEDEEPADIAVSQDVSDPTPKQGDIVVYTVTVENEGPGDAPDVYLDDEVVGQGTLVSADPEQGECSGTDRVHCELGSLSFGESTEVVIRVRAGVGDLEANEGATPPPGRAKFITPDGGGPGIENNAGGGSGKDDPDKSNNNSKKKKKKVKKCQASLTFGPILAHATCFKKKGDVWTSKGGVTFNGINLVKVKGHRKVAFTFNTRTMRAAATGRAGVKVGRLWIYQGSVNLNLRAGFRLKVMGGASLKGFRMTGRVQFELSRRRASLAVKATLPRALGSISGNATLRAESRVGLLWDTIGIKARRAYLGPVKISKLHVSYRRSNDQWRGGAKFELPSPRAPDVDAEFVFERGGFKSASVDADFKPGISLAYGVFLQKAGFTVEVNPLFLEGRMTLSAGPKIRRKTAASIDGRMSYRSSSGTYTLAGSLRLVDVRLADGELRFRRTGGLEMEGRLSYSKWRVGIKAEMNGWIAGTDAFSATGSGRIKLPGLPDPTGEAVVSSRGMAACGRPAGWDHAIGFGKRWGRRPNVMAGSCDIGPYKASSSSRDGKVRAAGTVHRFDVEAGKPLKALRFTGTTAAPRVTVTGPNGETASGPGDEAGVMNKRFVIFGIEELKTTHVVIERPAAGRWRVEVADESAPVTEVAQADGLPQPSVSVKTARSGGRTLVDFRVRRIRGQRVTFVERGRGVDAVIGTSTRSNGRLRFTPASGGARKRKIVAVVEQNGLPRATTTVARFKAPKRR